MPKAGDNAMLDAGLDSVRNRGDRMYICSAEPTLGSPVGGASLGSFDTPTYGANQDGTSGREMQVDGQTITPTGSGNVTHVAITDISDTDNVIYYTSTTSTAVTNGVNVDIGAWMINILDPT